MTTELEEKPKTELTVVQRAAIALNSAENRTKLRELAAQSVSIVDIKNKAAREQCHSAAMMLRTRRTGIRRVGKTAREDATAFQKAVISEEDELVEIIEPEEQRLIALRDGWDEAEAREKAAKLAAEQTRINAIKARIEGFMLHAVSVAAGTVAEIDAYATQLSEAVISLDDFAEYTGEGQAKRDTTVKWLRERQQHAIAQEAEAARLAAEREELMRLRAEQEERERVAAVEREAQAKKDREALAARLAELAEQERQAEAARREQARKDQAARDAAAAEQAKAAEKAAAILLAERVAHDALMEAQQEELNRKQALVDAAIAEQERIARDAREAAEAEERRQREAAEAAERAEAERIQAEKDAEAAAALAAQQAAEEEAERRERVDFIKNGPAPEQIILALADEYRVDAAVARDWLALHDWKLLEVA